MSGKRELPQRPAEAYFDVAAWLGDKFLSKPPPPSGRVVVVSHSSDHAKTTWYLPIGRSAALIDWVRAQPHLGVTAVYDYPEQEATIR